MYLFDVELYESLLFGILTPWDILFANTFSHLVCCLFILLIVSFAVQKLFSLMQFIFSFVSIV